MRNFARISRGQLSHIPTDDPSPVSDSSCGSPVICGTFSEPLLPRRSRSRNVRSSTRSGSGSVGRRMSERTSKCREVGPGGYLTDFDHQHSNGRQFSPGPSSSWRGDNPWLNSSRPLHRPTVFSPIGGAAGDIFTFPHYPDCAHCAHLLSPSEMRWGTGLCDDCYGQVSKSCKICHIVLPAHQLRWGSGLCNTCYDVCEKTCHYCDRSLQFEQVHWRTGLCDECYDGAEKICQLCETQLQWNQLHWASGLCDSCYDSCDKSCAICQRNLQTGMLRWGTGLCDVCYDMCQKFCGRCKVPLSKDQLRHQSGLCDHCYDKCDKACKMCSARMRIGEMHWSSGLCNRCYDLCEKTCKKCREPLSLAQLHWGSGLCNECHDSCDKKCMLCKEQIAEKEQHWDSGMCDRCYDTQTKQCAMCSATLQIGHLRWGTGLCDTCYDATEKTCRKCSITLDFRSLHWGTGMCDACYDKCNKLCKKCGEMRLSLGNLRYGTGICDSCYDATERRCRRCGAMMEFGPNSGGWGTGICNICYDDAKQVAMCRPKQKGLTSGIWAAIGAQLVFYMAPALLQPSLFLHIAAVSSAGAAPGIYAIVLTSASVAGMVAPVPLGLWAERRGEREVYVGITVLAGFAGFVIAFMSHPIVFASAWGALNSPPSIRGVRAALFSKHVPPEELSRAGQLASAAGLLGSVVGPALSTFVQKMLPENGFTVNGMLATLSHAVCACLIFWNLPADRPEKKREATTSAVQRVSAEDGEQLCDKCLKRLDPEEARYRSALCNTCYDSYRGIGFKRFKWRVMISFCAVAGLLELSENAAILGTFQPIAVTHFGWGSHEIAMTNLVSALLSVIVSLVSAQLRLPEACQVTVAACLYCLGCIFFTFPPIRKCTCFIGLVLGLKAQILFMAPFTSIFSRLIGRTRVTNRLTIALCLAPAVGGLVGTALAPLFFRFIDTWVFMLSTVPAVFAFVLILMGTRLMDGSW